MLSPYSLLFAILLPRSSREEEEEPLCGKIQKKTTNVNVCLSIASRQFEYFASVVLFISFISSLIDYRLVVRLGCWRRGRGVCFLFGRFCFYLGQAQRIGAADMGDHTN